MRVTISNTRDSEVFHDSEGLLSIPLGRLTVDVGEMRRHNQVAVLDSTWLGFGGMFTPDASPVVAGVLAKCLLDQPEGNVSEFVFLSSEDSRVAVVVTVDTETKSDKDRLIDEAIEMLSRGMYQSSYETQIVEKLINARHPAH